MKTKTFLVADTETTGLGNRAIVFDFGYVVATRKTVLKERSFLVRETLTNPAVMLAALGDDYWKANFGGKVFADYIPAIDAGNMRLYSWYEIIETMRDDMATYGVDVFAAYNLGFDMRAIATTQKHICETGKALSYRPDLLCLWNFACDTVCNTRLYNDVARAQDWVSDAGNIRTTAEKVYAFLTCDTDFIESHTALHDAQIETEILQRLLAKKKRIPYNEIDHMPWRKAQHFGG